MKTRVAIFPAGTEIGLEIYNSLKYSTHFELYGFSSIDDHSKFVYKNYESNLPNYDEDGFLNSINKIIMKYKIDFLFPAHDDVQLFLAEHSQVLHTKLLSSPVDTLRICRSKRKTYNYFSLFNFVPNYYSSYSYITNFPVFAKPDVGQGSKGIQILKDKEELFQLAKRENNYVICEYLPGEEYTVDCFTDMYGKLRVSKLRNRKRIRSGISVSSQVLEITDDVLEIANTINKELKFNGVWFFQLKRDSNNKLKLLEIGPRVSGTMGVSRNLGINFPLLTIYNFMQFDVKIIENYYNIEVDRALISRYKISFEYDNVYLDFDDTLVIDGLVNEFLMMFLFQSQNKKKNIFLITRHTGDIYNTLKLLNIDSTMFSEIYHLTNEEDKSEYISIPKSIYIDDSFRERMSVALLGIPVFDLDSVESLIDWKR